MRNIIGIGLFLFVTSRAVPVIAAAAGDPQGDADEYVSVSLDHADTVSGKTLMIAAYFIIFWLLLLYVWSLYRRQGQVEKAAAELEARLEQEPSESGG